MNEEPDGGIPNSGWGDPPGGGLGYSLCTNANERLFSRANWSYMTLQRRTEEIQLPNWRYNRPNMQKSRRMPPQSHGRFGWVRFAVGAFALCLMLFTALHTPPGVLTATAQHTAGSLAGHGKQPCLDSAAFDWTVPQSGFSLLFQPRRVQDGLGLLSIQYAPGPVEFRLYNRPPPLS